MKMIFELESDVNLLVMSPKGVISESDAEYLKQSGHEFKVLSHLNEMAQELAMKTYHCVLLHESIHPGKTQELLAKLSENRIVQNSHFFLISPRSTSESEWQALRSLGLCGVFKGPLTHYSWDLILKKKAS